MTPRIRTAALYLSTLPALACVPTETTQTETTQTEAVVAQTPEVHTSPNREGISAARASAIDEQVQGFFDSGSFPSLSVGVVEEDTLVYSRSLGMADRASGRPASSGTLYEIGSVGKVFTSTALAILHDRGVLRIDDPVERWVPAIAAVSRPADGGPPITLEHLATHTSGLPGVPTNVDHLPPFQWNGYSATDLQESFETTKLLHRPGAELVYSSLGMGLLGHVMATATGGSYEGVIANELLLPLGMEDTVISLSPAQEERYSIGYAADDSPGVVPYYEYGILSGCGAHRSTVTDLALFLQAQWGSPRKDTNPLNETVRSELHRVRWRADDDDGAIIALGWFAAPVEGVGTMLLHRGRTPGHSAVLAFIPEKRIGVILLSNRGGRDTSVKIADFAEELLLDFMSHAD